MAGDTVTFADFAHSMGTSNAAMANALRVHLKIKRTELATRTFDPAELEKNLKELKGEK